MNKLTSNSDISEVMDSMDWAYVSASELNHILFDSTVLYNILKSGNAVLQLCYFCSSLHG